MIEVEVNGVVHEFPDGTSQDVIRGALQKKYAPPSPQLTPAQEYANESPIARTVGRAGRNLAIGLSSLPDLGLLVPKTAALAGSVAADKMGFANAAQTLGKIGTTPTVASMTESAIDKATGNRLQPINGMEKAFDTGAQIISSSMPFTKGPEAVNMLTAAKPPSSGNAMLSVLDPETAINQVPAMKRTMLPVPKATDAGKKVVALAKQYDIPIGLDDVTDSGFYKTMISEGKTVPFSGSQKFADKQMNQFTKAVAKSVGLDTDKLTVEAIDEAFTNVGKQFDDLTKGKTFTMNDDVAEGLNEILTVAEKGGYGADGLKSYNDYLKDLGAVVDQSGVVDGETLAKLRAKLNAVGRKASDQNAKALANELESTISDFITDGSPEALRQAKYRYKNLIAIEPLAAKDQLGGQIPPAQLLGRVRQVYKRGFTRGNAGELGDLANIGQYIKETVPNSGTAQRTGARNLLTGNLIGVAPTLAFGGPLAATAQAGLSGVSMLANRALQSRNFDQELLDIAMRGGAPYRPLLSAPQASTLIGATGTQGNQMLQPPMLRLPAPTNQMLRQ